MSDSQSLQTSKRWQVVVGLAFAFVLSLCMLTLAFRHQATPNDAIGRFQMCVTNGGTVLIMDTVTGAVSSKYKIEDTAPTEVPPRTPSR
jgi:hypothetical protein